jgi:hypothetical protein
MSVPIQYYPVLFYINAHMERMYIVLTEKTQDANDVFGLLHKYSFFYAIRELFLWEVIHAHWNHLMEPAWQSAALQEFTKFIAMEIWDKQETVIPAYKFFNGFLLDSDHHHRQYMIEKFGPQAFFLPLTHSGQCV